MPSANHISVGHPKKPQPVSYEHNITSCVEKILLFGSIQQEVAAKVKVDMVIVDLYAQTEVNIPILVSDLADLLDPEHG